MAHEGRSRAATRMIPRSSRRRRRMMRRDAFATRSSRPRPRADRRRHRRVADRVPRRARARARASTGAGGDVPPRRIHRASRRSSRQLPQLPARAADRPGRASPATTCSTASATPRQSAARSARCCGRSRSTWRWSASARTATWRSTIRPPISRPTSPTSWCGSTSAAGASRWARAGSPRSRTCPRRRSRCRCGRSSRASAIVCVVPDAAEGRGGARVARGTGRSDDAGVDSAAPPGHHRLSRSRVRVRCSKAVTDGTPDPPSALVHRRAAVPLDGHQLHRSPDAQRARADVEERIPVDATPTSRWSSSRSASPIRSGRRPAAAGSIASARARVSAWRSRSIRLSAMLTSLATGLRSFFGLPLPARPG